MNYTPRCMMCQALSSGDIEIIKRIGRDRYMLVREINSNLELMFTIKELIDYGLVTEILIRKNLLKKKKMLLASKKGEPLNVADVVNIVVESKPFRSEEDFDF